LTIKMSMRLTERPLFYWVLKRFRGFQFVLLLIILAGLFFRIYPLEMQRQIINVAINLKMIDKLYLYCGLYMGAVLIAGLLKYLTNTMQAVLGEKILVGMRQEIYQHILQLPLPFFHRTQTGMIISSVTAELNPIASFLGNAVAVPIAAFLTLVTFVGFMIYLNPTLGLLSMIIYPFELTVIPLLQRWYNKYNRKRILTNRQITSLVNESVTGIHEVQGNAGYLLENNKLTRLIKRLYTVAVKLSVIKYGIKFSNNLFQSIGPFLLFLVGGYLAIKGEFTIGALVAFLSAYEKVYDPWKEVIEYYQTYQDAQVRYKQIMELLDHSPDFLLEAPERTPVQFSGAIEANNVNYNISESIQLINDVSFRLEAGQHLALVGFSGSGKSTLSLMISQLLKSSSGSLTIGGHEINTLSKLEMSLNTSSVAQHPFIFTGSVRDNLLYSCNSLYLNGLMNELPRREEIIEMVKEVGLAEDTIRWGLRSFIPPKRAEPMINSFMHMRQIIQQELREEFSQAVEFYNASEFQQYLSIAKNIIFGTYGGAFNNRKLIDNKEFRLFIKNIGLEDSLTELGFEISAATIKFLGDFRNALARAIFCFCPPDRLSPLLPT
jgi:ABC-type bacteriocin/lantibiotic exporter with double-glycine peptidase domain